MSFSIYHQVTTDIMTLIANSLYHVYLQCNIIININSTNNNFLFSMIFFKNKTERREIKRE